MRIVIEVTPTGGLTFQSDADPMIAVGVLATVSAQIIKKLTESPIVRPSGDGLIGTKQL